MKEVRVWRNVAHGKLTLERGLGVTVIREDLRQRVAVVIRKLLWLFADYHGTPLGQ